MQFWIFCDSHEGKEWKLPNWLSLHISNRSWTVDIPEGAPMWMLPYEFRIIQDWELNEAKFVHIDLKPCHPNIPNAQGSNMFWLSLKISLHLASVLYPFNWTAKNVGQWDDKNNFPSSQRSLSSIMVLLLAHRHYQHTGIISRAWTWFPKALSVVFSWNFHVAQNTSHSLDQYGHQKHTLETCTWKHGRHKIK